jgi:hypothetical protein
MLKSSLVTFLSRVHEDPSLFKQFKQTALVFIYDNVLWDHHFSFYHYCMILYGCKMSSCALKIFPLLHNFCPWNSGEQSGLTKSSRSQLPTIYCLDQQLCHKNFGEQNNPWSTERDSQFCPMRFRKAPLMHPKFEVSSSCILNSTVATFKPCLQRLLLPNLLWLIRCLMHLEKQKCYGTSVCPSGSHLSGPASYRPKRSIPNTCPPLAFSSAGPLAMGIAPARYDLL